MLRRGSGNREAHLVHRSIQIPTPRRSSVHKLPVLAPYRLDLTVSALRRLSSNIVDVITPSGAYARVLGSARAPVFVHVVQTRPALLTVTLEGATRDRTHALAILRRMLGVDRDVNPFFRAARRLPWLAPLAKRMRGVKPPRYPTLWEACVNAIVFQQVSLLAATAIMRRLLIALATPFTRDDITLYQFPSAEIFLDAPEKIGRASGLSANKLATLRRVSEALASGALEETMLEERVSPDAAALLTQIKGIGPWTATVILLRGMGRLDVFPMNDTSVARNLALVAGDLPFDVATTLKSLGAQRGMLYYHLLLARLAARGDVGRASESTVLAV
jgi:DNA-3-methyladenine glycosylase II